MAASDIPLRIIVSRLQATVNYLATIIGGSTTYGGLMLQSYLTLRGMTTNDIGAAKGAIIFNDIQGNTGLFLLDASSIAADDGLTTIHDASGRRWVRQQAPI